MKTLKCHILVFTILLLFAGCKTEKDLLEGEWDHVNVENIEAPYTYHWHFYDGIVTIRQICKSEPGNVEVVDEGIYRLKPVYDKTYLALRFDDPFFAGHSTDWQVKTLNKEILIIIHDDYGGVYQREFVKK